MKHLFILSSMLLQSVAYGQQEVTVTGLITTIEATPISNVDIVLKTRDSLPKIIAFAISNNDGQFKIRHPLASNSYFLEASAFNYEKMTKNIVITDEVNRINIDFILEDRIEELEEIELKAEKGRVSISNDTIRFNLEKLTDGTEQVVEDLLKKLPGIVVEENGSVLFKGKKIKALLLDGDNLFDGAYRLGTKNINAKDIQGIEAIQNFEDNPLLQGLSENDEVALNLKFKPGLSLSGQTDLGYGYKDRYYTNTTGIAITKKIKGFSLFKYNNMGRQSSSSQFNALDHITSSQSGNQSLYAPDYISTSDKGFSSTQNSIKNNEVFGSLNILPKLTAVDEFRINLDYLRDKSIQVNQFTTIINTDGQPITINQTDRHELRPKYFNAKAKYKRYLSRKSALVTQFNYTNSSNKQLSIGTRNGNDVGEQLNLQDYFYSNATNFTKRINTKSAYSIDFNAALSKKPQTVTLLSGIDFNTNQLVADATNTQKIAAKKASLHLTGNYFILGNNDRKLNFKSGLTYFKSDLLSELDDIDGNIAFRNDLTYQVLIPKLSIDYYIPIKKLSIRPTVLFQFFNYYHENFDIHQVNRGSRFLADVGIGLTYEFNELHGLTFNLNSNNTPPDEQHLFANYILLKNRVLKNNKLSFDKLANQNLTLGYRYSNLFKDFDFSIRYGYQQNKNAYLTSRFFDEQVSYFSNTLEDLGSTSSSWNASINQYVGFLKSSFNLSLSYRSTTYFNRLNNSSIRENKSDNFSLNLGVGTGLLWKFKFTNTLGYYYANYSTQNSNSFVNRRIVNSANLSSIISERLSIETHYTLQIPSLNTAQNTNHQVESAIIFKNKKKNMHYRLEGKNLLNQQRRNSIYTSDVSTVTSNNSLFERYFLLTVGFQF